MAYYEYECQECGKRFSVKQSFDQHDHEPKPKCPECHHHNVRQLITSLHVKTSRKS